MDEHLAPLIMVLVILMLTSATSPITPSTVSTVVNESDSTALHTSDPTTQNTGDTTTHNKSGSSNGDTIDPTTHQTSGSSNGDTIDLTTHHTSGSSNGDTIGSTNHHTSGSSNGDPIGSTTHHTSGSSNGDPIDPTTPHTRGSSNGDTIDPTTHHTSDPTTHYTSDPTTHHTSDPTTHYTGDPTTHHTSGSNDDHTSESTTLHTGDPFLLNVTVRRTTIKSVEIEIVKGIGNSYAFNVTATIVNGTNSSEWQGNFRQNETSAALNISTNDEPGTCFNLHILAISKSGDKDMKRGSVNKTNVCYNPSVPGVTFGQMTTKSIELVITKGSGNADAFNITAPKVNGTNSSKWSGNFLTNEISAKLNITTNDEPGTCFNLTIVAIIGFGEGAVTSGYVNKTNVCYKNSPDEVELDSKNIELQYSLRVPLLFVRELLNKDSDEYKNYSNEFRLKLSQAYQNAPGFVSIEILQFKNGSVITEFKVIFDIQYIDQSLTITEIYVIAILRNTTFFSAKADETYINETMLKTVKKDKENLHGNGVCHLLRNPCPFGYECWSNAVNKPICRHRCVSTTLSCGPNGQCFIDYLTNNTQCRCFATEKEYYYGDRCQYVGTNLPGGHLAFTATDYAIIGGSSAAGIIVIVIVILGIRFLRRAYTRDKGTEDLVDAEEEKPALRTDHSPSRNRSAFANTANIYDSGFPKMVKNHRVYRDPHTGEEAIIYQPTNVTMPLSSKSSQREPASNEPVYRRSVYDYIDTENLYKIKRPNLGGTRNWQEE